jgi:hypothetical protein
MAQPGPGDVKEILASVYESNAIVGDVEDAAPKGKRGLCAAAENEVGSHES